MAFHSYLDVRQYGIWEDRTVWEFLAPLKWSVFDGFISGEISVKFYSDFASAPRHFGMYENFGGKCNGPAGVHDLLYRTDAQIYIDLSKFPAERNFPGSAELWLSTRTASGWYNDFPKSLSDFVFKQLMIEDGESDSIYDRMYTAVKYGGSSSFHQFKVADKLPCSRIYTID